MLFLKSDSSSKHLSFFVFYFNISNEISSIPPRLLNFQEFSNLHCLSPLCLLSFEEFPNPSTPNYSKPPPSIRHSRVD